MFVFSYLYLFPFFVPMLSLAVLYASALAVYMHTVLPSKFLTATSPPRDGYIFDLLVHNSPLQTSERTS